MTSRSRRSARVWIAAFAAALGAIGVGVWLGEPGQMLQNAASLCLACLGVG